MISEKRDQKRIEWLLRLSIPQILIVLFFILSFVSISFPYFGVLKPSFILMALFYWSVYRPTLIPPIFCLCLGLLTDLITGMVPGMHAILFLLVRLIVSDQRRFLMGQPYIVSWIGFSLISFLFYFGIWLLVGLSGTGWGDLRDVLPNIIITIAFYPFITLILIAVHRILPVEAKPFA